VNARKVVLGVTALVGGYLLFFVLFVLSCGAQAGAG